MPWVLLGILLISTAGSARAAQVGPPKGRDFFGVTDTGTLDGFTNFASAVRTHPAVIETYLGFGTSPHGAISRWAALHARPMLHISTVAGRHHQEVITPRQIATGAGDQYLLTLNATFAADRILAFVRPLGEPNSCSNPYAAVACNKRRRGGASAYWYKKAFRRIYIILHGGVSLRAADVRLAGIGLPPISLRNGSPPAELPTAPIAVIWSPLPLGHPAVPANLPAHYWPGSRYVDWVGTDTFSDENDLGAVQDFYARFPGKPFALTEWAVGSDDPAFVKSSFRFMRSHPRCRVLVYYQDFAADSPYRLRSYPKSLRMVRRDLRWGRFVPFARDPPSPPSSPVHVP